MVTQSHTSASSSTGYGPSQLGSSRDYSYRPRFNGDEQSFDLWEVRFLSFMSIHDLKTTIAPATARFQNECAYITLVDLQLELLDSKSLCLVMNDAPNDGTEALEIFEHYQGRGPTTLEKSPDESVNDYLLRAETAMVWLRNTEEMAAMV